MQLVTTLFGLIDVVLNLYMWCFILAAILSWLVAFNIINTHNRFIYSIADGLYRITEPLLKPIRNLLPNFGGIDFAPLIAILLIIFVKDGIVRQIYIWLLTGR
ncbi:MAG: YggT family protein [Pseudomonadota bacterium]|nr:YggT family protein [Pseudomonadota bacterium]